MEAILAPKGSVNVQDFFLWQNDQPKKTAVPVD